MNNENKNRALTMEDLRFTPPELPHEKLKEFAFSCYGVEGEFVSLQGERDQNIKISSPDGRQYVLKVSGLTESAGAVDFQARALLHIELQDATLPVPRMVPGIGGKVVNRLQFVGESYMVRLLTFLPGMTYDESHLISTGGLYGIGAFLARLAIALEGFSHPASTEFMPWDICNGLVFNQQLKAQLPKPLAERLTPILARLESEVYPALGDLRRQVIHQDGHDGNLLRANGGDETVVGVIDFGDMIEGPLISDLAVSLASFLMGREDPVALIAAMCSGFHSVTALTVEEIGLLLDLIIVRLILWVQLYEFCIKHSNSVPASVTEELPIIIATLERLVKLDSADVRRSLLKACGLAH